MIASLFQIYSILYVLIRLAMPNLIKIGTTNRTTIAACIPSGMPRSVEAQHPHPTRIPLGMRPNKTN